MDKQLIKKIIDEYKSGVGSTTISKKLKVSKQKVLKILKEHNLTRKRDRCSKLSILQDGEIFKIEKKCPTCGNVGFITAKNKTIVCRNYYNSLTKKSNCKKCSLILQQGEGNPFFGKKHTEKTKKNISQSRKGKAVGQNNSMSKIEHRKKLSESLKKSWESGKLEETRKKMSEILKKTRRQGKLRSVIKSKKETEICKILKEMGYKVVPSLRVDTKICDIFIPSLNLIIEYFGDYWHCNPMKYESDYFNVKKKLSAKEIWKYDESKLELIKSYGYNLEVIWESELKLNNDKLLTIIKKYDSK
jgi:G:T-mismatch repair DNA endonuclease (very short patch repair protein)/phage FluMu protein Com